MSIFKETAEAFKSRLTNGVVGHFTLCFLIVHWRVVLYAVGTGEAEPRVRLIESYFDGVGFFQAFFEPLGWALLLFAVQFGLSLCIEAAQAFERNLQFNIRLRLDTNGDVYITKLETVVAKIALDLDQVAKEAPHDSRARCGTNATLLFDLIDRRPASKQGPKRTEQEYADARSRLKKSTDSANYVRFAHLI